MTGTFLRYFSIGGITLEIESDLAYPPQPFSAKLEKFSITGPGDDCVRVRYHFSLPTEPENSYGELVYHQKPWRIYRHAQGWTYVGFIEDPAQSIFQIVKADPDYRCLEIYHPDSRQFTRGNRQWLTISPTDQIALTPMLAERQGCYVHSAGVVLAGNGLLFVGHSSAGKSTLVKLLRSEAEILCDDRVILRRWPDGIKIHGTWSHGEIPEVSPASAPLRAIFYLEKAPHNALIPLSPAEAARRLPEHLIKTYAGRDWWMKMFDLVGAVAAQVPTYILQFDCSGQVLELLRGL
jgi:hypothetical protein